MEDFEKKYKEALGWMREMYPCLTDSLREDAEHFFPELNESEDERIRKTLLKWAGAHKGKWGVEDITFEDIVTWLEKQKATSDYNRMAPIYNDQESFEDSLDKAWAFYNNSGSSTVDGCEDNPIELAFAKGFREGFLYGIEKQKEQKKDNPLEDFSRGYNAGYYHGITDTEQKEKVVEFDHLKEEKHSLDLDNASQDYVYNHFCPGADFTPDYIKGLMEDAFVDGANWQKEQKTELCTPDSALQKIKRTITDCKKLSEHYKDTEENFYQYYGGKAEGLQLALTYFRNENEQPMKEQKPAEWSEEDERMLSRCIKSVECSKQFAESETFKKAKDAEITWLKLLHLNLKKKNEDVAKLCSNEWSEEDKENINAIVEALNWCNKEEVYPDDIDPDYLITWLKSLRPQPKQEWIEEDRRTIDRACVVLRAYANGNLPDILPSEILEYADRLQSLRPQPNTVSVENATKFGNLEYERGVKDGIQHSENHRWKPSKEQIDALKEASASWMNQEMGNSELLESLYNDLLKNYKL